MRYYVEVTIDGSMPLGREIKADSIEDAEDKAPGVFVQDARDRGYNYITEDLITIKDIQER